jgi:hypothetical protein
LSLEGTTQDACELLGIDKSTLTLWKQAGCDAYLTRNKWDLSRLVQWWGENISSPSDTDEPTIKEHKIRYESARADKLEMEVNKMRFELLPRADVEAALAELITISKKAFLMLPKIAPGFLDGLDKVAQRRRLENMVTEILTGIADGAKIEKIEQKIKISS